MDVYIVARVVLDDFLDFFQGRSGFELWIAG